MVVLGIIANTRGSARARHPLHIYILQAALGLGNRCQHMAITQEGCPPTRRQIVAEEARQHVICVEDYPCIPAVPSGKPREGLAEAECR